MSGGKGKVRCAIYTRKSSEEGLDQAFNSLDAQREACAAYIISQASEGWTALPDIYDDGGLSGGTLQRPALQRLLGDVAAGRIDIIVVYKVDRLTRSLLDFSKLVEAFDKVGTSFVSVTQSFNTTTSMGRLTLNMLLSFAQFEREVTAERIRDKIAASKAKGMWMGGIPPLGYAPEGRSLRIVDEHAALVRSVFERYLQLGNVRLVADSLAREKLISPTRTNGSGRSFGGGPLSRGQIYKLLANAIYVGEIRHGGKVHAGLHQPIIARGTWDRAQALLASHVQGVRGGKRAAALSLLAGKVFDAKGRPFITSHACKQQGDGAAARTRYRYYVRQAATPDMAAMRIPAVELEGAVRQTVAEMFGDAIALIGKASLDVLPARFAEIEARCGELAVDLEGRAQATLHELVEKVRVHDSRIEIDCSAVAVARLLQLEQMDGAPAIISLASAVRLTRSGRAMRLVNANGAAPEARPNAAAIKLLVKARRWWARLRVGDIDVTRLAANEQVSPAYVTRVVRLAFLAPSIVDAILAGGIMSAADATQLKSIGGVNARWCEQERRLLPTADRP